MKAIYSASNEFSGTVDAARRRVETIMSSPVRCIPASTSLGDALQVMVRSGVRHLAVLDEGGQFLGILSDRTIAAAWAVDPSCLAWTRSAMVIDAGPAVVRPGAQVLAAARVMRTVGTDAVAVVDEAGTILGILTGSDMIAQLAR
jgi:CBS domain-containing protein